MNIGNFNTDSLLSGWGPALKNGVYIFFWGLMILIAIGLIGWYFWSSYKKSKKFYPTPVTITYLNDNGTQKDNPYLMGGKFINRQGIWDFRIKIPKQVKVKELGYIPDFSKADTDGRINFITSGDGTIWQQYEKKLQVYEEEKVVDGEGKVTVIKHELIIKPVPTDIKTVTVNSLRSWRETVDKAKITTIGIAAGAFIIMVIAHLISLYIQTKIKCGG